MIGSFGNREAEAIWNGDHSRRLPPEIQGPALRKLMLIDAAVSLEDLRNPPGNHLEALRGDRKGQWSIRINRQWRICFEWNEGYAENIEIVDYH
jgi:proteic killer suppression protein